MRLSLEDCDVEKDITAFIKDLGTGQEIPDPPKFINFCRGDAETSSQASEDENYSVAQFARTMNPSYRASSPQPSMFESHHDPNNPLAKELGLQQDTQPIVQDDMDVALPSPIPQDHISVAPRQSAPLAQDRISVQDHVPAASRRSTAPPQDQINVASRRATAPPQDHIDVPSRHSGAPLQEHMSVVSRHSGAPPQDHMNNASRHSAAPSQDHMNVASRHTVAPLQHSQPAQSQRSIQPDPR
jgi:hypothetical protein